MSKYYAEKRKIDPTKPDGSSNNPDRVEIGPTDLAFSEWEAAGITVPQLSSMRQYRLDRLVDQLVQYDCGGLLLTDPLNIRYATDTTNMQVWNMHNPFRACLVLSDGYMVVWDYKQAPFLCEFNPLVKEVRSGSSLFYFACGDGHEAKAKAFAESVDELMRAHAGSNRNIAIDKIMIPGYEALKSLGLTIHEGEPLSERARAIKSSDEIAAMRCSIYATERCIDEMRKAAQPGITENEIWSVLHAENIKRGGEWIETRLLASGSRTNPWFQECGPRTVQNNEIVAFDTDLVGPYGMCCDISRTWFVGDGEPTPEMKRLYRYTVEHMQENVDLLKPGVSFYDLCHKGGHLREEFMAMRYGCKFHGIGLCDEWPQIPHPVDWVDGEFNGELQPGMTLCVEGLVGTKGGAFCIKLEDQLLITEAGYENLTHYPHDECLLG